MRSSLFLVIAASLIGAAPRQAAVDVTAEDVKQEFLHAWNGYKQYAWGHDELQPLSKTAHDWHADTLYMTPVDALDTMLVMGLDGEAAKTRDYIAEHLRFDKDIEVKNFEITIRILGGLLSAHEMTGDKRLLTLAEDLGNRLLPVFSSPTGMPYMFVNLKTGKTRQAVSNPAEIGTLILEFGTLSKLTGKPVYFDKAKRAIVELYKRRGRTGLVGEGINVETGEWTNKRTHIGGAIDSFYEYLIKCEKLFGDKDCGDMWRGSLTAINTHLADDGPGGLWYGEADMDSGRRGATTYGSLQAFFAAVLALGGDLDRAKRLQESGYKMWRLHGIEPEELDYKSLRVTSPGYQLRPEIIESAYYLSQLTHDPRYVEMGRAMFADLKKYCRTEAGYTVLQDVATKKQGDRMHSFFLAETLKYAYLLLAPDAIDLKKVVFNTEAHPLTH